MTNDFLRIELAFGCPSIIQAIPKDSPLVHLQRDLSSDKITFSVIGLDDLDVEIPNICKLSKSFENFLLFQHNFYLELSLNLKVPKSIFYKLLNLTFYYCCLNRNHPNESFSYHELRDICELICFELRNENLNIIYFRNQANIESECKYFKKFSNEQKLVIYFLIMFKRLRLFGLNNSLECL